MEECVLRVLGDEFNPEEFLATSDLTPCSTFMKGKRSANRRKIADTSGFTCEIGSGTLDRQVKRAVAFLSRHKNDLLGISATKTVESCYLDFGYECRLDDSAVVVQRDFLPVELLRLAGELRIGICLTLSTPIESSDDEDMRTASHLRY